MKFLFLLLLVLLVWTPLQAQTTLLPDTTEVDAVLARQVTAWNSGRVDSFMTGYWQSDSLVFVSRGSITYGYIQALNRYRSNYKDRAAMGQLSFELLSTRQLSAEYCLVVGKWALKRTQGDLGGYFTLLFRKIRGQWLIVLDHTS